MEKLEKDKHILTQLLRISTNVVNALSNETATDDYISQVVREYLTAKTPDAVLFQLALAELVTEHLKEYNHTLSLELKRIKRYENQTTGE